MSVTRDISICSEKIGQSKAFNLVLETITNCQALGMPEDRIIEEILVAIKLAHELS